VKVFSKRPLSAWGMLGAATIRADLARRRASERRPARPPRAPERFSERLRFRLLRP
jgi:hypothetical protein